MSERETLLTVIRDTWKAAAQLAEAEAAARSTTLGTTGLVTFGARAVAERLHAEARKIDAELAR